MLFLLPCSFPVYDMLMFNSRHRNSLVALRPQWKGEKKVMEIHIIRVLSTLCPDLPLLGSQPIKMARCSASFSPFPFSFPFFFLPQWVEEWVEQLKSPIQLMSWAGLLCREPVMEWISWSGQPLCSPGMIRLSWFSGLVCCHVQFQSQVLKKQRGQNSLLGRGKIAVGSFQTGLH